MKTSGYSLSYTTTTGERCLFFILLILVDTELVYSCHPILEYYNVFPISFAFKVYMKRNFQQFLVLLESALKDKIDAIYRLLITCLDPKL